MVVIIEPVFLAFPAERSLFNFMVKRLRTDISSNWVIKLQLQSVTDIVSAPYHSSLCFIQTGLQWWWSLSLSSLHLSQSALSLSNPVTMLGLSSRCGRRIPWTPYNQRGFFSAGARLALPSRCIRCETYNSTGSQYHWLQIRCVT